MFIIIYILLPLMNKYSVALLVGLANAKLDWNLESTFLQHLQEQANDLVLEPDKVVAL